MDIWKTFYMVGRYTYDSKQSMKLCVLGCVLGQARDEGGLSVYPSSSDFKWGGLAFTRRYPELCLSTNDVT